jgi:hypothetical protein
MMYFTENGEKTMTKNNYVVTHFSQKPFKLQAKIFYKNGHNHQGALKKWWIDISSRTSAIMILKRVVFGEGALIYLRPLYSL